MLETILLSVLVILVLILPLLSVKIEENLEIFLFGSGTLAATIAAVWSKELVIEALSEPIRISLAVLIVGLIFKRFHLYIRSFIHKTVDRIGLKKTMFLIVFLLGLLSSVITAIVSALILSEVASELCLKRHERIKLVIYTCFAISIGAVLTPIGEPLGTIVISKLQGAPHFADTFFIFKLFWPYILSAILILSFLAYRIVDMEKLAKCEHRAAFYSINDIFIRTGKVYLFVAGLVCLGYGLHSLAYKTIYNLHPQILYWVNLISAVLDNATLAAIEIVPEMSEKTLTYLIVSLLIGGGMMIPGNIPNIITSSKLGIKSKEWAVIAIPLGIILLFLYFIVLLIVMK